MDNNYTFIRIQLVNGNITFTYIDCFIIEDLPNEKIKLSLTLDNKTQDFRSFNIYKSALNTPYIEINNRFGGYMLAIKDTTMQSIYLASKEILTALEHKLLHADASTIINKQQLLVAVRKALKDYK